MIIGAVEAGGTKFVCGIGNERGRDSRPGELRDRAAGEDAGECYSYYSQKEVERSV